VDGATGVAAGLGEAAQRPALAGDDAGWFFCELTIPRPGDGGALASIVARLAALPVEGLRRRAAAAERDLFNLGITFTVYSKATAIDRILPFDLVPRVLTAGEWRILEAGVRQRVAALNLFLHDVYNAQRILKDGVVPPDLVLGNANDRPEMQGFPVPFSTYVHICGTDIVRDTDGTFRVLKDNARTPSGVSSVIENRHAMLRAFPDLMRGIALRPVDGYGIRLQEAMCKIAPPTLLTRRSCCSRPASPTARGSSPFFSPASWACRWWRVLILWSRTTASSCARPPGLPPCTRSIAASTTPSSTRPCSARTRCSACPA
jgi:hypothetical protein